MIFWIVNILVLGAILMLAHRAMKDELSTLTFTAVAYARFISCAVIGLVFFHLYPSKDSIDFYELSKYALDHNSLWSIVTGEFDQSEFLKKPRVSFFVQILSVFLFISGGSYWIASFYFSTIAFIASLYFVNQFAQVFPNEKKLAIVSFLFIPSVIFWSSGILKDTISYAAFITVTIQALKIHSGKRLNWAELIFGAISVFILFQLKHYLLITLLLFTGMLAITYWVKRLKSVKNIALAILLSVSLFALTQFIHPYLKVNRLPQTIYEINQTMIGFTSVEDQLGIEVSQPTWVSVISEVPSALYVGLFKPDFFDETPLWGLIHKLENLLLMSLIILSIFAAIKQKPKINWAIVLPAITCILILITLLTITTPNLGSLVRYRNVVSPFLFLMASILPYQYLSSKSN